MTRSGDFSNIAMCSLAASRSFALVRTGILGGCAAFVNADVQVLRPVQDGKSDRVKLPLAHQFSRRAVVLTGVGRLSRADAT